MLKKLAGFIVDRRKLLLVAAALICVISAVLLTQVEVNEDMTKYLADDSPMKIGLDIMNEEFPEAPTTQSVRVMFENLPEGEWATVLGRLEKMEFVSSVTYDENSKYHNKDGYLTGETMVCGNGKPFPLPKDFLQDGETLIFKDVRSRSVNLVRKGGKPIATVTFEGFSNLLLWRMDEAKYICIEPWTNLPDYENVEDIEFSQKSGVIKVDGKSNKKLVRTISYL